MTRGQTAGKRKRLRIILRIILGVLLAAILLVCAGFAIYVGDYYHADETAVQAMAPADGIATSKRMEATSCSHRPIPRPV